jgi:hypothetical protein
MSCLCGDSRLIGRHGLLLALVLSLTTACTSLPIAIPPEQNTFLGIASLLSDASNPEFGPSAATGPLRILVVHGMGTPGPYDFEAFIAALANRLRLAQIAPPPAVTDQPVGCPPPENPPPSGLIHPPPLYIDVDGVPQNAQARLYTYDFVSAANSSGRRVLEISYLYWAPLTKHVKCSALAETGAPPRQWFADVAKGFIDDVLGDVILYAGKYRDKVMRPSVQKALCYLIDGTPGSDARTCANANTNDPTVVISHSLGGYMVMDAIDNELDPRGIGALDKETGAYKFMETTQLVYMMANQLAFLDLTTLEKYPFPASQEQLLAFQRRGASANGGPGQLAQKFATEWMQIKLRSSVLAHGAANGGAEVSSGKRQIVAFSDPNDVLSWLVQRENLEFPQPVWHDVFLTNVYMSNGELSIPGIISDPVSAHTGYMSNSRVLELLVCGMSGGAVNVCLPNGAR